MSSSAPWWTSLFALVGSFGAVLVSLLVTGRRDNRSRFGDQKRTIYADFLVACGELRKLDVWPPNPAAAPSDTSDVVERIRTASMHTALVAHGDVTRHVNDAVVQAERLAGTVTTIRETSKPGHRGQIDERQRPAFEEARAAFNHTVNDFVKAARSDMNVRTPFEPSFPDTR